MNLQLINAVYNKSIHDCRCIPHFEMFCLYFQCNKDCESAIRKAPLEEIGEHFSPRPRARLTPIPSPVQRTKHSRDHGNRKHSQIWLWSLRNEEARCAYLDSNYPLALLEVNSTQISLESLLILLHPLNYTSLPYSIPTIQKSESTFGQ